LKIIVLIKQVPETSNVKMDPKTGTMIRKGIEQIINPLDLYAIEEAIRLKKKHGGEITTISMGPRSAEKALRESIAMGCDKGILLSNRAFAGADTWSTSYVLAKAIERMGKYDVIFCGERATDGDTGQVGPGIASWLDIPFLTYVSEIKKVEKNIIEAERNVESGYQILEIEKPALFTVVKEINFPRLPTLSGKKKAREIDIPVWGTEDIDVEKENLGLNGSPTRVVKISKPKVSRSGKMYKPDSEDALEETVNNIIEFLETKGII